jgi:hypothetical protein
MFRLPHRKIYSATAFALPTMVDLDARSLRKPIIELCVFHQLNIDGRSWLAYLIDWLAEA